MNQNENLVAGLARRLHQVWLDNHIKENGPNSPKFKPVPEFSGRTFKSFRGSRTGQTECITELRESNGATVAVRPATLTGCRLSESGVLEQNIAQDPSNLTTGLMHKLNGKLASAYLKELAGTRMGIEETADKIHEIWCENNKDWAPTELMVGYDDLPEAEKVKDRNVAVAFNGYMDEISNVAPTNDRTEQSPTARQLGDILSRENGVSPAGRFNTAVRAEIANDEALELAIRRPKIELTSQRTETPEYSAAEDGVGI